MNPLPKGPALRERVFAALRADIEDTNAATFQRVEAVRAIINEEPDAMSNKTTPEEAYNHGYDDRVIGLTFLGGPYEKPEQARAYRNGYEAAKQEELDPS